MSKICQWTRDEDDWGDYWEASCGQAYSFEYDLRERPETNGYTYCPNCGKKIELAEKEEEDAD